MVLNPIVLSFLIIRLNPIKVFVVTNGYMNVDDIKFPFFCLRVVVEQRYLPNLRCASFIWEWDKYKYSTRLVISKILISFLIFLCNSTPKTSKTLFAPTNVSVFIQNYLRINSRIGFRPVNKNFHFEDWLCNTGERSILIKIDSWYRYFYVNGYQITYLEKHAVVLI